MGKVRVIPVPAFSTTKNEGQTYGNLTALLFTDEKEEVYAIMAPFIVYNEVMGVKSAWQLFGFLEGDRDFIVKASFSTKINREFRLEFKDPDIYHSHLSLGGILVYSKEATSRFFGLTSESRDEDETNFTHRELMARLTLGINLADTLNLALVERFRQVEIQLGGIERLPFIADLFPTVEGLNHPTIWGHRLTLTHERRDDRTTPTRGEYLNLYAEWGHVFQDAQVTPFSKFGIQAKGWFPVKENRLIIVPNFQMQLGLGSEVPFFDQSMLGGEDTLRAFGLGRFVDDHFILTNLEWRIRVGKIHVMNVATEEEIAPFVDMGRVFSSFSRRFFDDWQVNPGVGLRVLVRPNVVGRLDVAFGQEGATFFVGLNFPF
jgi:outer membrane protein assembly factor BamA